MAGNQQTHEETDSCCQRCLSCTSTCLITLFWILSLIAYMLELMFGVWSTVLYYQHGHYVLFGVTTAAILIPVIVLTIVSLIWYYDQDRLYQLLQQAHPDDLELRRYKNLIGVGSLLSHVLLLGQVYRYGQIIILLITRTSVYDTVTLRRDSALLSFLHCFLTSAPLAVAQLYVVMIATMTDTPTNLSTSPYPISIGCLISAGISLVLSIFLYTGSDRLHTEKRRIVLPAYLTTFLWHMCLVPARIAAFALFTYAYGPYIAVVIGVHWIVAAIWTFTERTNFCGDLSTTPPKKRYYLEIPFVLVVSFIFTFIYFNVRDGSTLLRIIIYHLLTSIETLLIAALFYAAHTNLLYAPWMFALTVGFYILGMAFMFVYYAAWHPNRTEDCFLAGCPRSWDCCECFHKATLSIGNVDLPLNDAEITNEQPLQRHRMRSHGIHNSELPGNERSTELIRHDPRTNAINNLTLLTSGNGPIYTPMHVAQNARPSSNSIRNNRRSTSSIPNTRARALYGGHPATNNEPTNQVVALYENPVTNISMATPAPRDIVTNRHSSASQYNYPNSVPVNIYRSHSNQNNRQHKYNGVSMESQDIDVSKVSPKTTPLPRKQAWRYSDGYQLQCRPLPKLPRHSMFFGASNPLPSPIGEEPGQTGLDNGFVRKQSTPIVHVSSAEEPYGHRSSTRSRLSIASNPVNDYNRPSSVMRSSTHFDEKSYLESYYRQHMSRNDFLRNHSNHHSPLDSANSSPAHTKRSQLATPHRHRSLSPIQYGSRRSSDGYISSQRGSPYSRSANCTPKQSPYTPRRKRRPSNPLHTHDPMVEFTQLYSTGSKCSPSRHRHTSQISHSSQQTGDEVGGATSSSYLLSSDNHSEVVTNGATSDKPLSDNETPLTQTITEITPPPSSTESTQQSSTAETSSTGYINVSKVLNISSRTNNHFVSPTITSCGTLV